MTVMHNGNSFDDILRDVTQGVTRESRNEMLKIKAQHRKRNGRGFKRGKNYASELKNYTDEQLKHEYMEVYSHYMSEGPHEQHVPGYDNHYALCMIRMIFQERYKE